MIVDLIPILVALGILGYLTAKIQNIEELNYALYKQLNPPKYKELDVVRFFGINRAKYVVKEVKFNKSKMSYQYKIVNINNFNTRNEVDEFDLELFNENQKEQAESDENDVS